MTAAAISSSDAAKPAGVKPRGRPRGKPFAPGTGGTARGRKPGEESKVAKLPASISDAMPGLLEVVTRNALGGDMAAARILIERPIAPLRPRDATVTLPMPQNTTITAQANAVVTGMAAGQITVAQGAQFVSAIAHLQGITETDEMLRRIVELEKRFADEAH